MKLSLWSGSGPDGERLRARTRAANDSARAAVRSWNSRMLAEADDEVRRGTRWGRGALVLVPSVVATALIGLAIADGVLAASFNVANQKFALHVAELDGNGLGAVVAAENVENSNSSVAKQAVLHAGLKSAQIKGLCIIVTQPFLGMTYSITVSAGDNTVANGQNLYFDITDLDAAPAVLRNAILGKSADDVAVNGNSLGGLPGGFGLDLTQGTVTLNNVVGSAYQAQVAGSLTLPHLSIHVHPGTVTSC